MFSITLFVAIISGWTDYVKKNALFAEGICLRNAWFIDVYDLLISYLWDGTDCTLEISREIGRYSRRLCRPGSVSKNPARKCGTVTFFAYQFVMESK